MKIIKAFDFVAIGLVLGITVLSAVFIYAGAGTQSRVIIKGEKARWIYSREGTEIVNVPGPLGDTVVEIKDNRTRILESPCDNQTCVSAGSIRLHGQWIACLPNRVLVSIEGNIANDGNDEDNITVDAVVW